MTDLRIIEVFRHVSAAISIGYGLGKAIEFWERDVRNTGRSDPITGDEVKELQQMRLSDIVEAYYRIRESQEKGQGG